MMQCVRNLIESLWTDLKVITISVTSQTFQGKVSNSGSMMWVYFSNLANDDHLKKSDTVSAA
jgi:hypothetical protein